VDRLLDGSKTVEIRRRPWNVPDGTVVLLYASRDVKGIVGSVVVASTETDTPRRLWGRVSSHVGISRAEYYDYLAGAPTATAISVESVRRLEAPIALDELRQRYPAFVVPQSFRFVEDMEISQMLNGERRRLFGQRAVDARARR
jgi:predicted transcriptional regulator